MSLTFGSLFAGIGGFDLGFERAGMVCKWQVEIDDYAQRVLAKHWPDVRRRDDVRTFPPAPASDWRVDVICGGFPCQDISNCGHKVGIDGERSGLWRDMHRIVGVLRPKFVVVENVAALASRGIGRVLGDLAEIGFDAEWETISACAFGAPHARERLFVIAYAEGSRLQRSVQAKSVNKASGEEWNGESTRVLPRAWNRWVNERSDSRVANGISGRVGRVKAAGNAVVPQVAEWIGRRIVEASQTQPTTNGARR